MAELNRQVGASADDVRVRWDGEAWVFFLASSADLVGWNNSSYAKNGCGMRFTNITIPQGAIINTAYLTFTCHVSYSATVARSKIRGEDVDDAAQFSDLANYQGRPRTTAEVNWDSIPAWTIDSEYVSPEIKTIIKEIVDREGWSSGNDLVIFWDDHDDRSSHNPNTVREGYSYDGSSTKCPKLHIEYTLLAAGRSHGYIIG